MRCSLLNQKNIRGSRYNFMSNIEICDISSRSELGKFIKQVFYNFTFNEIDKETFEQILKQYIKKYDEILFDGEDIHKTIVNIIGRKRAKYLIALR